MTGRSGRRIATTAACRSRRRSAPCASGSSITGSRSSARQPERSRRVSGRPLGFQVLDAAREMVAIKEILPVAGNAGHLLVAGAQIAVGVLPEPIVLPALLHTRIGT